MGDKDLLLTWFGQFMTEPRYPEQIVGATRLELGGDLR